MRSDLVRERRARADLQVGDLGIGVIWRKNVLKPRCRRRGRDTARTPAPRSPAIAAAKRGCSAAARCRRRQRGQQRRRGHRLEVGRGAFARAVLGGDHLALLGDADAALHGAARLRADRREADGPPPRPTAPPRPWNELHARAGVGEHCRQRAGRLVQAPHRGQIAAVLVGIRIADHHFLIAARARPRRAPRAARASRA